MNSCILMAEIIQDPQLRYTSDNLAIAEMLVEFPALRAEDQLATLKVVGWGNLAMDIQSRFKRGDRVVIEGRLSMNTVERPEGFKEKRAELVAQKIHSLGADTELTASASTGGMNKASAATPTNVVPLESRRSATPPSSAATGQGAIAPPQVASPRTMAAPTPLATQTTSFSSREPTVPSSKQADQSLDEDDIPF